ncbi:MAG: DNA topoisomerase 3 [Myxococcales bacterium]|nr:DNA topoisomerase 3 [Myxococcales bacterium]
MRLFVTEKPSVARDLAKVLGAHRKGEACLEGDGVRVTWCLGHLIETATPEQHDPRWKRWDPETLPILPRQLELVPVKKTRAHFNAVKRHLRDRAVTEVVNACDAGREGELIFRYVYQVAGCQRPVLRFWVSSLTPAAIRAGLADLRPGARYDPLAHAARCRAEADWLVGMNATRALTSRSAHLLSVGRVQTPTLALVVAREQAIEAFVPEDYFEVEARLEAEAGGWVARWIGAVGAPPPEDKAQVGRLGDRAEADGLAARLRGAPAQVVAAERERQQVPPPQLYHLTALQQAANRRFGLTADQTLKAAQSLYERHKALTYPRTDSRHLTQDVAATLPQVVSAVAGVGPWAPVAQQIQAQGVPRLGRRFVDDGQVGDHHALLPTPTAPDLSKLNADERRVYELVVRRTLAMCLPPAEYAKTRLEAHAAGQRLEARGRVRLDPGWEVADPPPAPSGAAAAEAVELPLVEPGDPAQVVDTRVLSKQTRPPPRYTEATLLGAMERAGRELDDAALRAAMREAGLGTPATRAAILETLLRRDYLGRQGKLLVPRPLGRALVQAIPVEALTSPVLTGAWEQRLQAIADGQAPAMPFRRDIRAFVRHAVQALLAAPRVDLPAGAAPAERGRGRKGRRGRKGQRGTDGRGAERRGPPRRDVPRAEPPSPPARPGLPCPACGDGRVIRGRLAWGCDRWQAGCAFRVPFEVDGVAVPDDELDRLVRQGRTRLFAERPDASARSGTRRFRLALDGGALRWEARGENS